MMVGRAPFVSADDNQMELYQKILSGALFAELYATPTPPTLGQPCH